MGTPEDVAAEKYFTPPEEGMTLNEAIEIVRVLKSELDHPYQKRECDALQLLIEAGELAGKVATTHYQERKDE